MQVVNQYLQLQVKRKCLNKCIHLNLLRNIKPYVSEFYASGPDFFKLLQWRYRFVVSTVLWMLWIKAIQKEPAHFPIIWNAITWYFFNIYIYTYMQIYILNAVYICTYVYVYINSRYVYISFAIPMKFSICLL